MTTAGRPDPLAFLADELTELRRAHLYRPLRVMSSAQGPIVSVDGAAPSASPRTTTWDSPTIHGCARRRWPRSATSAWAAARCGRSPGR